jgi:hypothetical protein
MRGPTTAAHFFSSERDTSHECGSFIRQRREPLPAYGPPSPSATLDSRYISRDKSNGTQGSARPIHFSSQERERDSRSLQGEQRMEVDRHAQHQFSTVLRGREGKG